MLKLIYTHRICMAHRLVGHKGGCGRIHGHNYEIQITLLSEELNDMGMVLDFADVKRIAGGYLDMMWDHRIMLSAFDPLLENGEVRSALEENGLVIVPFNPTAESMAKALRFELTKLFGAEAGIYAIEVLVRETPTGAVSCE